MATLGANIDVGASRAGIVAEVVLPQKESLHAGTTKEHRSANGTSFGALKGYRCLVIEVAIVRETPA